MTRLLEFSIILASGFLLSVPVSCAPVGARTEHGDAAGPRPEDVFCWSGFVSESTGRFDEEVELPDMEQLPPDRGLMVTGVWIFSEAPQVVSNVRWSNYCTLFEVTSEGEKRQKLGMFCRDRVVEEYTGSPGWYFSPGSKIVLRPPHTWVSLNLVGYWVTP